MDLNNTQTEVGRHLYPGTSSLSVVVPSTVALQADNVVTNCGKQNLIGSNNNNNNDDSGEISSVAPVPAAANTASRKRKTRRFKNRLKTKKTPYFTSREKCNKKRIIGYPQSEAPNNTTQFLMDYHQEIDQLDTVKLMDDVEKKLRATRDSSITSPESGDELLCTSPEEEKEFLCKDFYATYSIVQEEQLTILPKNELIQLIINMDDRLNNVTRKLQMKNRISDIAALLSEAETDETETKLKLEVKELLVANERLHNENDRLRGENEELKSENKRLSLNQKTASSSSSSGSSSSCTTSSSESSSDMDEDPPATAGAVVNQEKSVEQNDSNKVKNIISHPVEAEEQVDVN